MEYRSNIYTNATSKTCITTTTLEEVANVIKTGYHTDLGNIAAIQQQYRQSQDKQDKLKLPIWTCSGTFEDRSDATITHHTGFVSLDIDDLGEKSLRKMREFLIQQPHTYMLWTSPSGNGLKLIVRVGGINPRNHKYVYAGIVAAYAAAGIQLDPTCKNISRGCFLGHDPNLYLNPDASAEFSAAAMEEIGRESMRRTDPDVESSSITTASNDKRDEQILGIILSAAVKQRISITSSYDSWIKVGTMIKKSQGEAGLRFFDKISQLDPSYDADAVARKYAQLDPNATLNIGSLIWIARQAGVQFQLPAPEIADVDIVTGETIKIIPRDQVMRRGKNTDAELYAAIHAAITELDDYFLDTDSDKIFRAPKGTQDPLDWQPITEKNRYVNLLQHHLAQRGIEVAKDMIWSTINNPAFLQSTRQAKQVFEMAHKAWDGKKGRVAELISSLPISPEDKPYAEKYIPIWLCNVVSNVYRTSPEAVNDVMLTFVGQNQNTGKTSFFKNLFWDDRMRVIGNLDPDSRDSQVRFARCFLFIYDEFAGFSKKDMAAVKRVISADSFDVRAAYADADSTLLRRCSFAGTANNEQMLVDDSGDRRYLVFTIPSALDFDVLDKIDRRQMWGEIVDMFLAGHQCKFSAADKQWLVGRNREVYTETTKEDTFISSRLTITGDKGDVLHPDELSRLVKTYEFSHGAVSEYHVRQKLKYRQGVTYTMCGPRERRFRGYVGVRVATQEDLNPITNATLTDTTRSLDLFLADED